MKTPIKVHIFDTNDHFCEDQIEMLVDVFDVGHGACALATAPTGSRLMLDCGYSADRPWFPSIEFFGQQINTLMLMNLDEDHVADLPALLENAQVGGLFTNPTISAEALAQMKPNGMRAGVAEAYELIDRFGVGLIGYWSRPLGGIHWHAFWNRYGLDFNDTNNLSLAVFVSFGRFTMLFGGDMETPGWASLMRLPAFRRRLTEVSVFVASHHGRENSKSDELFRYLRPDVVIISDGPKQHTTQETNTWFASRTIGVPDLDKIALGNPYARRRVLTTRNDGNFRIHCSSNGSCRIIGSGRQLAKSPGPQRLVSRSQVTPLAKALLEM